MKYLGTGKDVCPTCGGKKHDFEQHSRDSCIVVLRDRADDAEQRNTELTAALRPVMAWRDRLSEWDGGCALPSEPKKWEWDRLREAQLPENTNEAT